MEFSVGLLEIQSLAAAITALDRMTKTADVSLVAIERRLGGRLVTLVIKGDVSSVNAALEVGIEAGNQIGVVKSSECLPRPHPEILKFWGI